MTYSETIKAIAASIGSRFDEVYHSAEIVTADKKFPAINQDGEWINLSPTDTKETIYIRRTGDDEVIEDLKIGSCSKSYRMRTPLRIVYFMESGNDKRAFFDLMQSVLITGTKLKSVSRDKWKLGKDESSGDYKFGPKTVYFAIDVFALWLLLPDSCEQDFCLDTQNPLKKEQCPVVV